MGLDGASFYSRVSLDADIAAADLVIAAVRSPQVIASDDTDLNEALQHVHKLVLFFIFIRGISLRSHTIHGA